ncbi:MAG: hypothetical protein FWE04_00575 [Oscillospiraceae bacterium]|nr:hypothetical protein [Oscillospiraceae bacterium]
MPTGTLQMKVSTADGTLPVFDATVKVSDALGHIVYTLTTDTDGMTTMVSLFAPSRKLSQSPYTSALAYSSYQILITHPGYVPQIIRGVRVFEGEGGLLPVDLVARTARTDHGDSINIIEIPPLGASQRMESPPPPGLPPQVETPPRVAQWGEFPPPGISIGG